MIDAFAWALVLGSLFVQLVLCRLFYLWLRRRVFADELKPVGACLLFCILMALLPWLVVGGMGGLGSFFYTHYPQFRSASWDVSLVWTLSFLYVLSYFLSVVCAVLVCTRLWVAGKRAA